MLLNIIKHKMSVVGGVGKAVVVGWSVGWPHAGGMCLCQQGTTPYRGQAKVNQEIVFPYVH